MSPYFQNSQTYVPAATLDSLSLVKDHVLPLDSLEVLDILDHQLVTGDEHMKGGILLVEQLLVPVLPDDLPLLRISPVRQSLGGTTQILKVPSG